jgi:MFS family permease
LNAHTETVEDRTPAGGLSLESIRPWALYRAGERWVFLSILFLVVTSSYFDSYILSVVLDPIKREFHVSDTALGLLSGFSYALVYAVTALPLARWADYGNRCTLIALALAGWSVITAACGFARSFGYLVLARFGLGLVQPGAMPPAQSLVADYFPPDRWGIASSVLNVGSAAGYLFGVVLGGLVAAQFGWRMAFFVAGVPGIVLAILAKTLLKEPRMRVGFPRGGAQGESMRAACRALLKKRSFQRCLIAISVYVIFASGVNIFIPSFMIRTLSASLTQVSLIWGFTISIANFAGALIGGTVSDAIGRRDIRWYAWLPAIACVGAAPFYWLALGVHGLWLFITFDFIAELIVNTGVTVCFAPIHAVCGSARRAMAVSFVQMSFMLVGFGFGPFAAGGMSDAFGTMFGPDGLRYSLMAMVAFLLPAALAFYQAGVAMPADLEA